MKGKRINSFHPKFNIIYCQANKDVLQAFTASIVLIQEHK